MEALGQLQSGLKYLASAGETGRRSLDGMLGPVNGAIGEITGATSELEGLPFVGPALGAKLQRVMRGVNAAQAKVGQVVATYNTATDGDQQDRRQGQSGAGQHRAHRRLCHGFDAGTGSGEAVPALADHPAQRPQGAAVFLQSRHGGF